MPREGVPLTGGRLPQTRDDLELFFEHGEAIRGRRERDGVRRVLPVVPTGPETELDPTAAHRVGLRDLDRERPGETECHRGHQGAEPDTCGLTADRGERHPRVGGTRSRRALTDALVVVGAEERVEAEALGPQRDGEQLVVGRALLGLGEDA